MDAFQSFVLGGLSKTAAPETLRMLGKQASLRYLKHGEDLNGSIRKIAEENSLNPQQIARVCEFANQETHQAIWPVEQDKTKVASFQVADPAKIVVVVPQEDGAPPAGSSGEFMGPPSDASATGPTMSELFGGHGAGHDGFTVPEKKQVIVILQKTAADRRTVTDDMVKLAMSYEHELGNLYRLVKQAYFGDGISLEDLYAVAVQEGHHEVAKELFPKFAASLHRDTARSSLTKLAWKAPEDLIDYEVPVTVVNGAQPILISLDALKRYHDQEQVFNFHLARIDDENKIYSQRLRELS